MNILWRIAMLLTLAIFDVIIICIALALSLLFIKETGSMPQGSFGEVILFITHGAAVISLLALIPISNMYAWGYDPENPYS